MGKIAFVRSIKENNGIDFIHEFVYLFPLPAVALYVGCETVKLEVKVGSLIDLYRCSSHVQNRASHVWTKLQIWPGLKINLDQSV